VPTFSLTISISPIISLPLSPSPFLTQCAVQYSVMASILSKIPWKCVLISPRW
jgi:hypothetical protein